MPGSALASRSASGSPESQSAVQNQAWSESIRPLERLRRSSAAPSRVFSDRCSTSSCNSVFVMPIFSHASAMASAGVLLRSPEMAEIGS
jgi:hypothetical protein